MELHTASLSPNLRNSDLPLVSIGLPVYNGGRYLRAALDSLLAQDYANIELIISDNASTDDTEAICEEYAARDTRIRYHRQLQNQGAIWNFNRAFELSSGPYFMWAAYDDMRAPSYVRRCVEALEATPKAAVCCTQVQFIDEANNVIPTNEAHPWPCGTPTGKSLGDRIAHLAGTGSWYDFYGLMRSSTLKTTRLCQQTWGFDVVMELELCLRGNYIVLEDPLFIYRIFRTKTSEQQASTLSTVQTRPSYTAFTLEMVGGINHAPINKLYKRVLVHKFLWHWLVLNLWVRDSVQVDVMEFLRRAWANREYKKVCLLVWMFLLTHYDKLPESRVYRGVYWKANSVLPSLMRRLPSPSDPARGRG